MTRQKTVAMMATMNTKWTLTILPTTMSIGVISKIKLSLPKIASTRCCIDEEVETEHRSPNHHHSITDLIGDGKNNNT